MRRERAEQRLSGKSIALPGAGQDAGQIFRREGEYWTIAYQGELFRLRDVKGLRYIARLLGRPGERLAASDLILDADHGAPRDTDAEHARLAVTKRIKEALKKIRENHASLGDHLAANVKTGRLCVYAPAEARRISWSL